MPLHLADVHLHRARLFHDRHALAEARVLIERHHYYRRTRHAREPWIDAGLGAAFPSLTGRPGPGDERE